MPLLHGLVVVRSGIHGYGVAATRPWAVGEVLADVDGVVWRQGEAVDDRYSLFIAPGLFFDMVDQTRWINHSCAPNAGVEKGVEPDGRVWARLVARRPLAVGDEVTYDYAFPDELAEPCTCGAATCRGQIREG
jgi:SET domain-containing protein